MPQVTVWICSLALILVSACSTTSREPTPSIGPLSQSFHENYDLVWKSVQLALVAYPIRINDPDTGIIETEAIRGNKIWSPPGESEPPTGGAKYKINIRILKGETPKVIVSKNIELRRDFFSDPERVPSDGLEELSILYRIQRELKIERAFRDRDGLLDE